MARIDPAPGAQATPRALANSPAPRPDPRPGGGPDRTRVIDHRRARRRGPWVAAGVGLLAAAALFPVDGPVFSVLRGLGRGAGGDLRRELEAVQQFGQFGSTLLIAVVVWLLDPPNRRRLLDWAAAVGVGAMILTPMKMLVGRPRPRLGEADRLGFVDPGAVPGPLGGYPLGPDVGVRHGWEVWADISSDLWSMPSSHTAYAAIAAVFLWSLYPRLRPLVVALAVAVGVCRVLFGAHWPSDVAAGAGIGAGVGLAAVGNLWGVRGLDAVWRAVVDRRAPAAWRGVVRGSRRVRRGANLAVTIPERWPSG